MYYNPGTGSYCNDFMEHIIDTEFRTDVPYKIDKEKYNEILLKYNEISRFKTTDVVTFSMDYNFSSSSKGEDGESPYMYSFFVWPKNTPDGSDDFYDGSDDFYDCILFDDDKYDDKHKEAYENFIKELTACIIGVDVPTAMVKKQELSTELKKKLDELIEFEAIINLATKENDI